MQVSSCLIVRMTHLSQAKEVSISMLTDAGIRLAWEGWQLLRVLSHLGNLEHRFWCGSQFAHVRSIDLLGMLRLIAQDQKWAMIRVSQGVLCLRHLCIGTVSVAFFVLSWMDRQQWLQLILLSCLVKAKAVKAWVHVVAQWHLSEHQAPFILTLYWYLVAYQPVQVQWGASSSESGSHRRISSHVHWPTLHLEL